MDWQPGQLVKLKVASRHLAQYGLYVGKVGEYLRPYPATDGPDDDKDWHVIRFAGNGDYVFDDDSLESA